MRRQNVVFYQTHVTGTLPHFQPGRLIGAKRIDCGETAYKKAGHYFQRCGFVNGNSGAGFIGLQIYFSPG